MHDHVRNVDLSITAQLLKKRHYNSSIKAKEGKCCISFLLDLFVTFSIKGKSKEAYLMKGEIVFANTFIRSFISGIFVFNCLDECKAFALMQKNQKIKANQNVAHCIIIFLRHSRISFVDFRAFCQAAPPSVQQVH
jgi:hypothetical protein